MSVENNVFEEMLVSYDGKKWSKATVIKTFKNGRCLAITARDFNNLENRNNTYRAGFYNHYKPLPKKKMVPYTQEECVIWAATEGSSGWVARYGNGNTPVTTGSCNYDDIISVYERAKITNGKIGEWEKFEKEVEV